MICIECSHPVPSLFTRYSNGYVKLNYCNNCNSVCDKYVEFDLVILFIDILLLKSRAYKHLIFNTLLSGDKNENKYPRLNASAFTTSSTTDITDILSPMDTTIKVPILQADLKKTDENNELDDAVIVEGNQLIPHTESNLITFKRWCRSHGKLIRLTISFLLFEVYLNWAYEEIRTKHTAFFQCVLQRATIVQYAIFSLQCILEFIFSHLIIQGCIYIIQYSNQDILYSKGAVFSTVLIASSTKLFPILMLIWPYDSQISTTLINTYFTNMNLLEALRITIEIRFHESLMIVVLSGILKKVGASILLILLSKNFIMKQELSQVTVQELLKQEFEAECFFCSCHIFENSS